MKETPANKERDFLMLQVIHAFLLHNTKGRQALQLIWRSIPDVYITREEMAGQYEEVVTARYMTDIWNFYSDIVEDCSSPKPRSLQHYCRVIIRTALSDNRQLYEGIDKLKLPSKMQSFLKLEE
ncbi:hypothetical protein AVEN_52801-1 [Araneus ventricosus]|uniref:SOCS box domain-containing protein n=1 Tax=Araneus ventricosus TaxID=182803 RepID=A0A4Y2SX32_ARAVE|nr:hypothetical protein AVEN_52801-1 [Araneus ventricosus]